MTVTSIHKSMLVFTSLLCMVFTLTTCNSAGTEAGLTGNVIFIHPDGTGVNTWNALRILEQGPDGMINWDRLDELGVYRSHQLHAMGTSSNAGAMPSGSRQRSMTMASIPTDLSNPHLARISASWWKPRKQIWLSV